MQRTDYNGDIHQRYKDARTLPAETGLLWMNILRQYVDSAEELTIVDLGSGTGRFSALLADSLHAQVIGVEPADKMRDIAIQGKKSPDVHYISGSAEEIPLENDSCDLIWMSMVIHHIAGLDKAASEMHRVLRPNGKVFIRNSFKDRLQSVIFYKFFPKAYLIDNDRLPGVESVKKTFIENRFRFLHLEAVNQVTDKTFKDYVERIRKRGLSTFDYISDDEFNTGIRHMEQAAQSEDPLRQISEDIDYLVFEKAY